MSGRQNKLLIFFLIGIIGISWFYGIRYFFFNEHNSVENDPVVRASNYWLKLADADQWKQMPALTRAVSPEQFLDRYKADSQSLGTVLHRKFKRKSSYNSKQGKLIVIEYDIVIKGKKRSVSQKVFIVENKGNSEVPYQVIDTRYIVRLPQLFSNSMTYYSNSNNIRSGDPVSLARKWFNDFDNGKLEKCSLITFPKHHFDRGRFFFDPSKATVDLQFWDKLKKNRKPGKPTKRRIIHKQHWKGIPGASPIEVFAMVTRADYKKMYRFERVWAYKDNYHPDPKWELYSVHFGKLKKTGKRTKKRK